MSRATSTRTVSNILVYPTVGPVQLAKLHARYKRFLADCSFDSSFKAKEGDIVNTDSSIVVHCPNTGPMVSLLPSSRERPLTCAVSSTVDPKSKRKYRYTLEMVQCPIYKTWVGVHSALANRIVENCLKGNLIPELEGFTSIRREVKVGDSTIDFELIFDSDDGIKKKKSSDGS